MNAKRANAGFSLVEVVCAIFILGVALVALIQGITAALSSSKESELQTGAALIAAGQIETLRAEGYLEEGETEGKEELSPYRWKQSVTRTPIDGLHEVTVVVENATSGRAIYELRTLLFDPPAESESSRTNARNRSARTQAEGRR